MRVQDYVLSVAVSHEAQYIVSGSKDRGVQFWDARTAQVQLTLQGHKNSGGSFMNLAASIVLISSEQSSRLILARQATSSLLAVATRRRVYGATAASASGWIENAIVAPAELLSYPIDLALSLIFCWPVYYSPN